MRGSAIRHDLSMLRNTFPVRQLSMTVPKKSGMGLNLKEEPTEEEKAADEAEDNLIIERLNAEILAESGVELDQLINPSKVVNLERDLLSLRKQLAITTDIEEIASIQKSMDKKSATLIIEKRGVMRGWLKNLFVGQSVLAGMKNILLKSHQIHTERLLLNIARNYFPAPSAPFYTTVLFDVLQILRISHYQSLLNVKVNKPLSHFIA